MAKVTRKQAEDILQAIKQRYRAYIETPEDGPTLRVLAQREAGRWSINWEDGPDEWALRVFGGGFNEEIFWEANAEFGETKARELATESAFPQPHADAVFVEPIYSFELGLYPR